MRPVLLLAEFLDHPDEDTPVLRACGQVLAVIAQVQVGDWGGVALQRSQKPGMGELVLLLLVLVGRLGLLAWGGLGDLPRN